MAHPPWPSEVANKWIRKDSVHPSTTCRIPHPPSLSSSRSREMFLRLRGLDGECTGTNKQLTCEAGRGRRASERAVYGCSVLRRGRQTARKWPRQQLAPFGLRRLLILPVFIAELACGLWRSWKHGFSGACLYLHNNPPPPKKPAAAFNVCVKEEGGRKYAGWFGNLKTNCLLNGRWMGKI